MFYTIQLDHGPNEYLSIRDKRSPKQLASALSDDGVLVVERGDIVFGGLSYEDANGNTVESHSFNFTYRNRVVLMAKHILRIDETVLRPGTTVTED